MLFSEKFNEPAAEKLADVARELHIKLIDGCSRKYHSLGLRFMAPLATVFASWVLGRAQKKGVVRLYFLSRDCQLILEAARKLAPAFGDIECRYLKVSRQSLFLPSATEISELGMPWLFEDTPRHALGAQLAKLELTVEEFLPLFPRAAEEGGDYILEGDDDIRAFWLALNELPIRDKLMTLITERRFAARTYFEKEGLFEDVPWAVVDIGWLLRCQRALNELLRGLGRTEAVRGFYLGVQPNREPEEKTGPVEALFENMPVEEDGLPPILFKQVILIENVFCTASHPTVHRYEDGPCYNRETDPAALARFQALENVFRSFAGRCVGFAEELAEPITAAVLIEHLVDGFLNNPVADTIRPLADIQVSFLKNDLDPLPLVRPLSLREALVPAWPSWTVFESARKQPRVMWHRGSVAVSRPWIQKVYFFAYRVRSVRLRFKWLR